MAAMRDAGLRALGLLKSIGAIRPSLPKRSAARRWLAQVVAVGLLAGVGVSGGAFGAAAQVYVETVSRGGNDPVSVGFSRNFVFNALSSISFGGGNFQVKTNGDPSLATITLKLWAGSSCSGTLLAQTGPTGPASALPINHSFAPATEFHFAVPVPLTAGVYCARYRQMRQTEGQISIPQGQLPACGNGRLVHLRQPAAAIAEPRQERREQQCWHGDSIELHSDRHRLNDHLWSRRYNSDLRHRRHVCLV